MKRLTRYVPKWLFLFCPFIAIAVVASLSQSSENESGLEEQAAMPLPAESRPSLVSPVQDLTSSLPLLPEEFPAVSSDGYIYVETKDGTRKRTTLDPVLQSGMDQYIKQNGSPIAAVVIADAKTGKILAMAQGQHYEIPGKPARHTALYSGFPAASLFKNVTTAASLEVAEVNEDAGIGLIGGCSDVHTRGVWLSEIIRNQRDPMTLRRAYGQSCNGFYAKLAVNYSGLGAVINYAHRFGWGRSLPTDFALPPSPFLAPNPTGSSIHTVGRFAAGFGPVGLSAAHGAWYSLAMANDGQVRPLTIFADTPEIDTSTYEPLYTAKTGRIFRDIMSRTPNGGTASAIYRKRPYRHLASLVGGKTGTLIGDAPRGLTTWFTGMMPLDNPQVVVAAVVIAGDLWLIKGTQLAAEGFRQWNELHQKNVALSGSPRGKENSSRNVH
jgi:cell division protein FtsI/penicillin-binding protein 2